MKKLILVVLAVSMCAGIAMAGDTWGYAWPNNSIAKSFDSLKMVTTVTDTSKIYWFKKNNDVAQVWIDSRAKAATATAYNHPLINYKFVDGSGNSYGSDSANGWFKLCDSSHVTINAAAHTYQKKVITNKTGVKGIIFKGALAAAESTITLIRVTE